MNTTTKGLLIAMGFGFIGGIFFGIGDIVLVRNIPALLGSTCYFVAGYIYAKSVK